MREPAALAAWWADLLSTSWGEPFGGFAVVDADPIFIGFQQVPEAKVVKNRVHLDLQVDDLNAAGQRALTMGASTVRPVWRDEGQSGFVVMSDPAGNEFCFVTDPNGTFERAVRQSQRRTREQ